MKRGEPMIGRRRRSKMAGTVIRRFLSATYGAVQPDFT
jgi:hypothetical protein